MSMNLPGTVTNDKGPTRKGRPVRVIVLVVAALFAAGAGAWAWRVWISPPETEDLGDVDQVRRGPLTIDITLGGQIQNRDLVKVRCEVEGRTSIINLVGEGTHVTKGDLLVELDASSLKDQKEQQLLTVDRGEASWVNARESLAVTESQTASNVEVAKLNYDFAKMDLEKYLKGDYEQELMKAKNDITIAEQQQARAADKLKWSTDLHDKKFISDDEFEGDRLDLVQKDLNLQLSRNKLELLEKYTRSRNVTQLESDVKQTEAALERARRKANADVVQAQAELKSKESERTRQKERLAKLEEQVAKCLITAPVDGMVVYATTGQQSRRGGSSEPLADGVEVRERQDLIYLPVSTKMMAEIKIPESSLKKVKVGQRVRITVDSQKDKTYWARVGKIGLLPDAASWWSNPDLKVYNTDIHIDGDAGDLRAGMSCQAQVIVAQYDDALYVPIQSVVRIGGQTVVFVKTGDGSEKRPVEIGMDNGRMVHLLSGGVEGEKVLLAPPLGESAAPLSNGTAPESTGDAKTPADTKAPDGGKQPEGGAFDPSQTRNLSPEDRKKMFDNMTDEQKEAMKKMREKGGVRKRRTPRTPDGTEGKTQEP